MTTVDLIQDTVHIQNMSVEIVDLKEKQVHDALIEMGWTPPKTYLPHTHVASIDNIDLCSHCGQDIRNEVHMRGDDL